MDSGTKRPNLRIESLYRHDVIMNISKSDIKTFQQTLLMLIAVFTLLTFIYHAGHFRGPISTMCY